MKLPVLPFLWYFMFLRSTYFP